MPHHSTAYVDVADCCRRCSAAWSDCRSVCLSVYHDPEPCKNGWTNLDAIWVVDSGGPSKHLLDRVHIGATCQIW